MMLSLMVTNSTYVKQNVNLVIGVGVVGVPPGKAVFTAGHSRFYHFLSPIFEMLKWYEFSTRDSDYPRFNVFICKHSAYFCNVIMKT